MCHFVTMIVREGHEEGLTHVLGRHERSPKRMNNPSIAGLLAVGEGQYITAKHCDCGTALGIAREEEERIAARLVVQRKRLSRLRWSEAKMERWTRDRNAADTRRKKRGDSIEYWDGLIEELGRAGITQVGLLLHCYSGALDLPFDCSAEPTVRRSDRCEALAWLEEDILVRFATDL